MFYAMKRNLLIYFSSLSNVILSILGALISVILYFIFLKQSMLDGFRQIANYKVILDWWLIGGTMTIATITSSLNVVGQLVKDKENHRYNDLRMASNLGFKKLILSYIGVASIISYFMQIIVMFTLILIFQHIDNLQLPQISWLYLNLSMLFSAIVWSVFNLALVISIKSVSNLAKIISIISPTAGFFAGVYLPFGSLPDFAKKIVEITPAPYNAAILRYQFLQNNISTVGKNNVSYIMKYLGLKLSVLNHNLNNINNLFIMLLLSIVILILSSLKIFIKNRVNN